MAKVPISVAPEPLLSVARWKRSVKLEPVEAEPVLLIVAASVTGVAAVAELGVIKEAERSGATPPDTVRVAAAVAVPPGPVHETL